MDGGLRAGSLLTDVPGAAAGLPRLNQQLDLWF